MIFEEQLILEAQIYGVLSLVLICVMLWMVIAEKRKYDKTNGRKKK
jgi:formate/nitrite transporter FocA (FNT family)